MAIWMSCLPADLDDQARLRFSRGNNDYVGPSEGLDDREDFLHHRFAPAFSLLSLFRRWVTKASYLAQADSQCTSSESFRHLYPGCLRAETHSVQQIRILVSHEHLAEACRLSQVCLYGHAHLGRLAACPRVCRQ